MKTVEEYAKAGEHHDVMDALTLLTKAYISQCGISLGTRTVIYCAAEAWQERLAWLDLLLSKKARKEPFINLMPLITDEYNPEKYDRYDIAGMNEEELLSSCRMIARENEFDDVTKEVMCWGLLKAVEEKERLEIEIETVASDGTLLKGILHEQEIGDTSVTMMSPYEDVYLVKRELCRDAKEILSQGYEDYQRLQTLEAKVRALHPQYLEELAKEESNWKKMFVFRKVYKDLIGEIVISSPEDLFREWYGLKFYDVLIGELI
jgi:hypothetical protein